MPSDSLTEEGYFHKSRPVMTEYFTLGLHSIFRHPKWVKYASNKKKSECQTKAGNQECFEKLKNLIENYENFENMKNDPWDMLNNFCFHV